MTTIPQPPGWARPRGFANDIAVRSGTTVYIAGQIGWTGEGRWQARDSAGRSPTSSRFSRRPAASPTTGCA